MTPLREQLWTAEEDEQLTKLWDDHVPAPEISRRLPGRTVEAVRDRAAALDLPSRKSLRSVRSGRRRYDQED
jgi:hypothetical protein